MYSVQITFDLQEEVTPELFAVKVALACAKGGALREGESVQVPDSGVRQLTDGERYFNRFTHAGWNETTLGGMLKESVTVPNIESSIV